MDLETYESDLADYSLQDSPFYEASRPMIFDLSMSAVNSLMAANVASGSGKNALMLKVATTGPAMDGNSMPTNYSTSSSNGRNEHRSNDAKTSMRFDMSHRHGMVGIPNGNNNNRIAPVPLELTANASGSSLLSSSLSSMTAAGPEPTKKKRKCVSFLPNYVQVCAQCAILLLSYAISSFLFNSIRIRRWHVFIYSLSFFFFFFGNNVANRSQIYLE